VRSSLAAALVLVALLAAPAGASPDDLVARPLVLAPGAVDLRLTAELAVEYRQAIRPVSLAPDAWLGVSDRWTLGLVHSDASVDRIGTGASLCVGSSDHCDHVYRGSGVDARYSALAGDFALAPRVRALIRDVGPFKPAVTLGALVRWTRGRFAITSDPYVRIPLANAALGNRSALVVPIWLAVQPAAGWLVAAHTGYDADFVVLRDGGHGPVSLVVTARVTAELELTVEAGWGQLLGPQHDAKTGTVLVTAGWRRQAR
jgi:hypothetical protein